MNLLYDSGRKVLDVIKRLRTSGIVLSGWGQHHKWYNKLKRVYRKTSEIHRKKGANYKERLKEAAQEYLQVSVDLLVKILLSKEELYAYIASGDASIKDVQLVEDLEYYLKMLVKHRDLMKRRIMEGESIPHEEKIFSVFEPHTEWNVKGKLNKGVELGRNTSIVTDQYQFILLSRIHENQVDKSLTIEIGRSVHEHYAEPGTHLQSISFDRNYYSRPAVKALSKLYDEVILPKPGKKSAAQSTLESSQGFVQKRKSHSGVEANINKLEHTSLDKCRDKGQEGFKRYVAYGVLAYNLHQFGRIVLELRKKERSAKE